MENRNDLYRSVSTTDGFILRAMSELHEKYGDNLPKILSKNAIEINFHNIRNDLNCYRRFISFYNQNKRELENAKSIVE